jgi:hypothetical protein
VGVPPQVVDARLKASEVAVRVSDLMKTYSEREEAAEKEMMELQLRADLPPKPDAAGADDEGNEADAAAAKRAAPLLELDDFFKRAREEVLSLGEAPPADMSLAAASTVDSMDKSKHLMDSRNSKLVALLHKMVQSVRAAEEAHTISASALKRKLNEAGEAAAKRETELRRLISVATVEANLMRDKLSEAEASGRDLAAKLEETRSSLTTELDIARVARQKADAEKAQLSLQLAKEKVRRTSPPLRPAFPDLRQVKRKLPKLFFC